MPPDYETVAAVQPTAGGSWMAGPVKQVITVQDKIFR
jgi:hypothetical protein